MELTVQFWAAIAQGATSEDAALAIGVSPAVGTRWFRHAGGVNPSLAPTVSGRSLAFAEREDIAVWHAQKLGVREIARQIGGDMVSTVGRLDVFPDIPNAIPGRVVMSSISLLSAMPYLVVAMPEP